MDFIFFCKYFCQNYDILNKNFIMINICLQVMCSGKVLKYFLNNMASSEA